MKKTILTKIAFLLAFLIVGVMSCKKEEIEPEPDPVLPNAELVKILFTDPADGTAGVEYTTDDAVIYETEDQAVVVALRSPVAPTQLEIVIGGAVQETITTFTANADLTEYTSDSYSTTIADLALNYGGGTVITLRATFPAGAGTATLNKDFSVQWGVLSTEKTGVELIRQNGEILNLSVTPMDADGEDPSTTPVDFGDKGIGYNFPDRYTNHYLTIDDLQIEGGVGVLDFMYTEDFTVSMWIDLVGAFGDPALFSNANYSDANDGFLDEDGNPTDGFNFSRGFTMLTGGGNYTTYLSVRDADTPSEPRVSHIKEKSVSVGLEDTGWHLWTVTIDRAGKAVLYTDGIEATVSTQGGVDISGIIGSIESGLPWNIAQDGTGIQQSYKTDRDDNFLEGMITNIVIYDYVVSPEEVADIYTALQ
ncbi:MAG: hypothetical protein KAR21_15530 [Spirochaetales bacterium]|nr:hypothetical protein [Spirochaetales bacterium]